MKKYKIKKGGIVYYTTAMLKILSLPLCILVVAFVMFLIG